MNTRTYPTSNPLRLRLFWLGAAFSLKTNTFRYSLFKDALLQAKTALSSAKIAFGIGSNMESPKNVPSGDANPGDSDNRNKRSRDATPFSFPDWSTVLAASDLLDREKASFEIAIKRYLGFCSRSRSRASFAFAKAFIETVTRERNPESY
jgi:hypothetical protein